MVPNKCQKQVRSIADGGVDALHRAPADVQAEAASVFTLLQLCFVSLASECRTPRPHLLFQNVRGRLGHFGKFSPSVGGSLNRRCLKSAGDVWELTSLLEVYYRLRPLASELVVKWKLLFPIFPVSVSDETACCHPAGFPNSYSAAPETAPSLLSVFVQGKTVTSKSVIMCHISSGLCVFVLPPIFGAG